MSLTQTWLRPRETPPLPPPPCKHFLHRGWRLPSPIRPCLWHACPAGSAPERVGDAAPVRATPNERLSSGQGVGGRQRLGIPPAVAWTPAPALVTGRGGAVLTHSPGGRGCWFQGTQTILTWISTKSSDGISCGRSLALPVCPSFCSQKHTDSHRSFRIFIVSW